MFFNFSTSIICLFYIFSTTALVASAVIGVDLGTEYIKATLVKPGIPLDIVLTKDSRRKEISAIAFKPEKIIKSGHFPERLYGSDAIALASRLPGDVYPNLKPLLGIGIDSLIVKEYATRYPKLKLTMDKTRGTAAFKSGAFSPEELPWTVEEILAMELQNIQKNAQAMAGKGTVIKDLVITIPTFFTVEEKRAVLIAADLAGLRVLELISDGLAVGINYATTRTFPSINEGGKAETHLIFDMGAGSTTASILRFQGKTVKDVGKFNKTIQEVKVLGSGWDRTLGGDFFNSIIVDDMVAQFVASPPAKNKAFDVNAIKSNGKIASKLYKEAEKMRQVLSANTNTQSFFEELYEDVDFKYKITRANFEKLIEAQIPRISATIQKSLETAGLKKEDLDSIILYGGMSRTPFVQRELEKIFGDARRIKTNVNSDESAVFGAGFRGAALSPSFRVKEIRISDSMTYASGVKWTNAQDKKQSQGLWKASSAIGDEKQYAFRNYQDPFVLSFYQQIPSLEESSSELTDKEILVITTQNLTDSVSLLTGNHGCTKTDITIRLSTRVTPESGEIDITKLVVGCETEASGEKETMVKNVKGLFGFGKKEQAPLSDEEASDSTSTTTTPVEMTSSTSQTDASPSATTFAANEKTNKTSKTLHLIPLKFTTEIKTQPQLPTSEITRMKERLAAFSRSDNLRRMRDESLNRLEGLTYKIRDFLEESEFISVSTQKERTSLELKSKDISEWIYSEGIEASKEELKEKLQQLEDLISPIEFRKTEMSIRPEKIIALQSALNETNQLILSVTEQIASDKKKLSEILASNSNSNSEASATEKPSNVEEPTSSQEEVSTTTDTAPIEMPTLDQPIYTDADLTTPKTLFDEYSSWLTNKLVEQEKLEKTNDPVLLSKDIDEKVKNLQDANIQLLMKNLQQAYRSRSSNFENKSKKTHQTKTKEENADKSSDVPRATFTVGADGKIPSQEEMLEHLKKIEDLKSDSKPEGSKDEERGSENDPKHVEL
ncbi:Hypoxia up-regulated protein 1 [Golovinomyces cichoracearum]|uniref:Hypoxia up-regulated protein 1 n=1 Tax=Golovinomyces cichoracearum TaxID=62708 RepID=A0A420J2N5_9PEZI|nr:Hypoxia up-regulated protein 1 [Golovinomyces cichoracearum]